jgi:hypothetical protein
MSETYLRPKDPASVEDYTYTFAGSLADGITLASHVINVISAGGASVVASSQTSSGLVTFRVSGGTHLDYLVIDIVGTLSDGQVLPGAVRIPIIDGQTAATITEVQSITAELAAVRAARAAFLSGGAVKQAWSGRYGNRMTYETPTLKDYNDMIVMLQRDLERATNLEAGLSSRGRIGFRWAS